MKSKTSFFVVFFLILSNILSGQNAVNLSLQKEARLSIRNGLNWLEKNQQSNGSWSQYPAITALATAAYLKSPFELNEVNTPAVSRGLQFILDSQQPDGGIYIDEMKSYNTSISLLALVAADNPIYDDEIQRARDFLLSLQLNEDKGYASTDYYYGGVGYDSKGRSDLSNLEWALESMRESEEYQKISEAFGKPVKITTEKNTVMGGSEEQVFWENAIVFIQRCQNYSKTNDQDWAGDDGGFIYSPSESKAGDYTSYGSMTYAGMKSFIWAGLDKQDHRVQAALQWIRNNYTVDKNPQMGEQGLYYYFHTMAKALSVFEDDYINSPDGIKHNWRKDLIEKLISIQNGEGYWVNQNNRWWENNKDLVTAYSLLALIYALE